MVLCTRHKSLEHISCGMPIKDHDVLRKWIKTASACKVNAPSMTVWTCSSFCEARPWSASGSSRDNWCAGGGGNCRGCRSFGSNGGHRRPRFHEGLEERGRFGSGPLKESPQERVHGLRSPSSHLQQGSKAARQQGKAQGPQQSGWARTKRISPGPQLTRAASTHPSQAWFHLIEKLSQVRASPVLRLLTLLEPQVLEGRASWSFPATGAPLLLMESLVTKPCSWKPLQYGVLCLLASLLLPVVPRKLASARQTCKDPNANNMKKSCRLSVPPPAWSSACGKLVLLPECLHKPKAALQWPWLLVLSWTRATAWVGLGLTKAITWGKRMQCQHTDYTQATAQAEL